MRKGLLTAGIAGLSLVTGLAGCTIVLPDTPAKPASQASTAPVAVAQQVSNFAGSWDTTYGIMTLTVVGNKVTGDYGKIGKITGTTSADDKVLEGTWTEGTVTGSVTFRLSADTDQITGIWNETGGSKRKDWTGSRLRAATQVK